jgi:CO dehydrogenase maturation factor
MSIKAAFSGKGGAGKTTLASLFIRSLARQGHKVLAVDCDPVANLGRFLGIRDADRITPIIEMKELISERTEVGPEGALYKLNPVVDDIPDKFAKKAGSIRLIVMGTVKAGGAGCVCPQAGFLKALLGELLLQDNESIVMDMEAGIEHLGRATASSVQHLFIVTEPNLASVDTARKIARLAGDLKIKAISVILNKVRTRQDLDFVRGEIQGLDLAGQVPFDERIFEFGQNRDIDIENTDAYLAVKEIRDKILSLKERAISDEQAKT